MNQTKRILALALALVMVFATCSVLAVAAAEAVATAQKGDVNQNGKIDMTDYILVKRQYFNTFKLTDEQLDLADVNNNGKIDMTDYILVKRMYFGTYTLPVVPEEPSEDTSSDVSEDASSEAPVVSEDASSEAPVVSEDASSEAPSEEPSVSEEPSDEPELGTFDNPYVVELGAMRPVGVYVPAGGEVYVKAANANGTTLNVGYATNANYQIYYGRMPVMPEGEDNTCSIEMQPFQDFVTVLNPSEEDVVLYFTLTEGAIGDTTGTMDNPKELVLEDSFGALRAFDDVALEAGNQGYWYTVTAPAEGVIYVQIGVYDDNFSDLGWMYCVNNITAGKYGDNHWSDDEDAVNYEFVAVSEGDVIQIFASTYNPEDPWTAPAGNVTVSIAFNEYGSADAPFSAVLGDNTATVKEGSQGVYYTYTAEQDGTLVVTMPEGDWVYCVNNLSSYIYGDTQWSDSDPVVYAFEIAVYTGDEIQIMVNTYDSENPWSAPAGEIVWNLAYKVVVPTPDEEDPDVSVPTPDEEDPDVSKPEVSDPEVSEPEVSEPEVSEPEVSEPEVINPINLVAGRDYLMSGEPYANYTTANLTDGKGNNWTDPNGAWCWSKGNGEYAGNLVDGKGSVIFDLGAYCTIYDVNTHVYVYEDWGIKVPVAINVYVSTDGEEYFELGASTLPVYAGHYEVLWATLSAKATNVRFVKVEFVNEYGMNIFDEVEVLGIVTAELETEEPEVSEPEVSEPEVSEPEVSEPETSEPETSEPEVSEPEVSEPEVSEPEVSEPEVSEPEVSEPEVSVPTDDEVDPETSEPETSEPETSEPDEPVVNPASNVVTLWNNTGYEGDSSNVVIYTDASVYANTKLEWWRHIAFAPVEGKDGIYVVTAITIGDNGGSGGDNCLEIPEGGFVWCAFEWPERGAGAYSIAIMNTLHVGDYVEVTGIDPVAGTNTADADIQKWVDPSADPFYVTTFNPTSPIGNDGVIYTTTNTNNGWWYQVSFAPNGANWKVVELQLCNGSKATIPEGGFVWALHSTNEYADYKYISGMAIGEIYSITGLDLENLTIAGNATITRVSGIISKGASYTTSATTYRDGQADDGVKLTNGIKSYPYFGMDPYSVWSATEGTITVDLGSVREVSGFTTYTFAGVWGIGAINGFTISVSEDGVTWTDNVATALVADATVTDIASQLGADYAGASTYVLSVSIDTPVKAQFVKFNISANGWIWIDEVEVMGK